MQSRLRSERLVRPLLVLLQDPFHPLDDLVIVVSRVKTQLADPLGSRVGSVGAILLLFFRLLCDRLDLGQRRQPGEAEEFVVCWPLPRVLVQAALDKFLGRCGVSLGRKIGRVTLNDGLHWRQHGPISPQGGREHKR